MLRTMIAIGEFCDRRALAALSPFRLSGPLLGLAGVVGCAQAFNYSEAGPRFADAEVVAPPRRSVRIVTFNTHFAERVDQQIELFQSDSDLRAADVVALQEMDEQSVARIATILGFNYVYYPATFHPSAGKNFGNALLARWPIDDDQKIVLPHLGGRHHTQRAAVEGTVRIGDQRVRVFVVHLGTLLEIGFHGQEEQAEAVLQAADTSSYPVIIAGDLNSHRTGKVFERAGFEWPTKSLGRTYSLFDFDHILIRGLEVASGSPAGIVPDPGHTSDHRPVWAELTLPTSVLVQDEGAALQSGVP
jgi:endonuclease/exonuclease/phosphatase family metal-dependent hydrolase